MTDRARLPNRRLAKTFTLAVAGLTYTCTVGRFADGRLAEVFLTNHRAGSDAGAAASDSAVVCSIALQYGVPLDVIRKALMRDSRGQARTPLAAGGAPASRRRSQKGLGVVTGVPDMIAIREGHVFAIELKAQGGRLSVARLDAHEVLHKAGAEVAIASP